MLKHLSYSLIFSSSERFRSWSWYLPADLFSTSRFVPYCPQPQNDKWLNEAPPPAGDHWEQLPIVDMNLCGTTGEEDDGGVGGRRPGSPLCGSAEGGSGGSGLSGLPTGPGCTSPWPLPHQGGLQPDWYVYCDEGQSRLQHVVVLNILLLPQTCSFHHRRQTRKTQTRTNFTSFCAFLNCDSNKFCH